MAAIVVDRLSKTFRDHIPAGHAQVLVRRGLDARLILLRD